VNKRDGHEKFIQTTLNSCRNQQLLPHRYCLDCLCIECGVSGSTLNLPICKGAKLCSYHKCSINICTNRKGSGDDMMYCDKHTCLLCMDCVDISCVGNTYCVSHKCLHPDHPCGNVRLDQSTTCSATATATAVTIISKSLYCMLHTCRICYTMNIPSKNVLEEYPRNACEDHLLCNSISKNGMPCCELAVPPINLYCNMHIMRDIIVDPGDGQCYGIAKSTKKRCKR
jgi:hypothetical protein